MEFPPIHHVSSLAAVDRGALVPGVFAHPYTAQSIGVRDKMGVDRLVWFSNRRLSGDTSGLDKFCTLAGYVAVTFDGVSPVLPNCFEEISGAANFNIYRIN